MKTCPNCQSNFKPSIVIDGKLRKCGGRKFCFKCSPYGARNTRNDLSKPVLSKKRPYKDWTPKQKWAAQARYYRRGLRRKENLVKSKGGCCQKCAYNKCLRALTFHHRDPKLKQFDLTIREISGLSWESVFLEAQKCDLYCINCHMELEDQIGRSKYAI